MDSSAVPQFLAQGDFLGLPQFEKSMICLKMTKKIVICILDILQMSSILNRIEILRNIVYGFS